MSFKPKKRRKPESGAFPRRWSVAAGRLKAAWQRLRGLRFNDPYLWGVLLLPLMIPILNSAAVFSRAGFLDEWYYYSYFRHLVEFKRTLFPDTYYGSRMSWLVPGYLVNRMLPPLAANYVLHMGVYYTGALSLYYILKRHYDRQAAFLGSLAFTAYPYLWAAVGTDYVDGPAISSYLFGFALLTRSATGYGRRFFLLLAGIAYAAGIYMNTVWLVFSPTFLFYYVYLARPRGFPEWRRALIRFALWFGLGAAVLTVILGVINRSIDGHFWFYAPSLQFTLDNGNKVLPWKSKTYDWLKSATWLVYPGLAMLAGLVLWLRRLILRSREGGGPADIFHLNLAYCVICLVVLEWRGMDFLELVYYASTLIPLTFLAFSAQLFGRHEEGRPGPVPLAAAALVFLVPWCRMGGFVWTPLSRAGFGALVAVAACGILMRAALPKNRTALAACVLGLGVLNLSLGASLGYLSAPRDGARDAFRRLTKGMDLVDRVKKDRPILFWFNAEDPNHNEFDSLNSLYLWGYTWMGRDFPGIAEAAGKRLWGGSVIAVLSSSGEPGPILEQARGALAGYGFTAGFLERDAIEQGGVRYDVTFLDLQRQ